MTRLNAPVGDDDLTAYVDGELPEERRAFVEQWLDHHLVERERVEKDRLIKQRLQDTLGPLGDKSLPDQLRVRQIRTDRTRQRVGAMQRLAAVLVLVAVSGASGWMLRGAVPEPQPTSGDFKAALVAYNLYVPEKLHPVEVSADAREHLGKWLGNRIGSPVSVPDLSANGLQLLGGRLVPGEGGQPAGQLMYETESGKRVTLFLQKGVGEDSAFAFSTHDGLQMFAWRSPELAYYLTGDLDKETLLGIAHAVYDWRL